MSIKRIFSSHAFQSPCSLPLNGPLVSLLFLSSQAVLNASSFFPAFPSTEGIWEDTLNFLFNAILNIIKTKKQSTKFKSLKQVSMADYFPHNALPPLEEMASCNRTSLGGDCLGVGPDTLSDSHSPFCPVPQPGGRDRSGAVPGANGATLSQTHSAGQPLSEGCP